MPAARRKRAAGKKQGSPAWIWLLAGILIGLGMAYYLWSKGYIPQPEIDQSVSSESSGQGSVEDGEEMAPASKESKSRYDFFTVLPEMEVIVPEQELDQQRRQQEQADPRTADETHYVLQVGSFRDGSDAEEMKARLALLGVTARVQPVTVNDATWHRVRVGPVSGSQQADEMRRRLADNGIESLVMKAQ